MPLDDAVFAADGIQYSGNAMTNILAYNVTHKNNRQKNTYSGINETEIVFVLTGKSTGKQVLDQMGSVFYDDRR